MIERFKNIVSKYPALIIFTTALLIGLYTLDDYGLAWDEEEQRKIGLHNFNYAFKNDTTFLHYSARDYGVAFELPLVLFEKAAKLSDTRVIFLWRHFLTLLFYLVGGLFCYKLSWRLFNNKLLASLGFLLVLLCPRIYADSFTNTKDIPFMSLFFIGFYFFLKAFEHKRTRDFVVFGLVAGITINLRIIGAMLYCAAMVFLLLDVFLEKNIGKNMRLMLVFTLVTSLTLYVTWPYLWSNPIANMKAAFERMSKFDWDATTLFKGQMISAQKLNWDYFPTWFSVTIPEGYLLLGLIGFCALVVNFIKAPLNFLKNSPKRGYLLYVACMALPLMAVIVLRSSLFDGWRHLYFIYAPFVMLCLYALNALLTGKARKPVLAATICVLLFTGINMVIYFPYNNIYFNNLVDKKTPEYLRTHFELDYWGVSYRKSLEYILAHDDSDMIAIFPENYPGYANSLLLIEKERKRLVFLSDSIGAKYFVTNYRWHPGDYTGIEHLKWHNLKVGNNTINAIYKLR